MERLPPLPRQHSAAIGCTKNYQPIGVTVHHRIVLRALKVSYSDVGEGGVAVKCENNTIFPEHPVLVLDILYNEPAGILASTGDILFKLLQK